MFKKIFFGLIAVAGLASCNGDYQNWVSPQSNEENEAASGQATASLATKTCVVDNYAEGDSIQMLTVSTGDNVTVSSWTITLMTDAVSYDKQYNVYASATGKVAVDDLSAAVIYLYDRQVVERTLSASISATKNVTTPDGIVNVTETFVDADNIVVTPRTSNFPEYIYVAGNYNGWGNSTEALWSPNLDGIYTGYGYLNGGTKFRGNPDNWDSSINYGGADGKLGGADIQVEEGMYKIEVNLVSETYALTKINTLTLIGPAINGDTSWGTDSDPLTWDAAVCGYTITTALTAGEFKIRADKSWSTSWGYDANGMATTNNGGNISVAEAGTYTVVFKPSCDGMGTITVTKSQDED